MLYFIALAFPVLNCSLFAVNEGMWKNDGNETFALSEFKILGRSCRFEVLTNTSANIDIDGKLYTVDFFPASNDKKTPMIGQIKIDETKTVDILVLSQNSIQVSLMDSTVPEISSVYLSRVFDDKFDVEAFVLSIGITSILALVFYLAYKGINK